MGVKHLVILDGLYSKYLRFEYFHLHFLKINLTKLTSNLTNNFLIPQGFQPNN